MRSYHQSTVVPCGAEPFPDFSHFLSYVIRLTAMIQRGVLITVAIVFVASGAIQGAMGL